MALNKILEHYQNEMIAEGAWCGHSYTPEYLANIRNDLIAAFTEITNRYSYKDGYMYKDGQMCISTNEKNIYNNAQRGLFMLEDDYDEIITKIYGLDEMTDREKYIIADSLNNEFKNKLQEAIDNAKEILKSTSEYTEKDTEATKETDEDYTR